MGGDVGPRDRGAARAAVGLEHVAVDPQRALAERLEVGDGADRAADEALDLDRAPALLAAARLAVDAVAGRRGEQRVLGGDPTAAAALEPARDAFLHRRRTEHDRLALRVEHRPVRLLEVVGPGSRAAADARAAVRPLDSSRHVLSGHGPRASPTHEGGATHDPRAGDGTGKCVACLCRNCAECVPIRPQRAVRDTAAQGSAGGGPAARDTAVGRRHAASSSVSSTRSTRSRGSWRNRPRRSPRNRAPASPRA